MTDEVLDVMELDAIVKTLLKHMDRSEFDRFIRTIKECPGTTAGVMVLAANLRQDDLR